MTLEYTMLMNEVKEALDDARRFRSLVKLLQKDEDKDKLIGVIRGATPSNIRLALDCLKEYLDE